MPSPLRLALFGPPGAGKGTQAQLLKEQLGVEHISSGDLFRYHLRNETPLGQQVSGYVNQGLLVPDELTIGIILDRLLEMPPEEGFLLDGFPRNVQQAHALEETLEEKSRQLDKVVLISVDTQELLRRLAGRYTCRECQTPHTLPEGADAEQAACGSCGGELYQRDDDRPESVQNRLEVYENETFPVVDFYQQRGMVADVPGLGSIPEVNGRVLAALGLPSPDDN